MDKRAAVVVIGLGAGVVLHAQSAHLAANSKSQASNSRGTQAQVLAEAQSARERSVRVELAKPLQAKKAKAGTRVTAELMENLQFDQTVVAPRGSKIVGRVVQVQRSEGKSAVTLAFDHAEAYGAKRPLVAVIKAVGAPTEIYSAHWSSARTNPNGKPQPQLDALSVHGRLADNAQGVWGMPGVSLEEASPQGTVLRSKTEDFKLQAGTQMILRVSRQ